jgi:DNA-binding NarL/FixJ family response regulator
MQKITILLADDHNVVREGLRALLLADGGMEIVGEAEDGGQAVELAKKLSPDVAVIDIGMPVLDGLEATRQITHSVPFTRVLILSSFCNDDYVQRAIEAGAVGYLAKQAAGNDLLKAIREVDNGNAFFSSLAAKRLLDQCREHLFSGHPTNASVFGESEKMDLTECVEVLSR